MHPLRRLKNSQVRGDWRAVLLQLKRLVRPGLSFKSFQTASQTIAGYKVMAKVRKGQAVSVPVNDMQARRDFIAGLFSAAA
jgi:hypothetical protein